MLCTSLVVLGGKFGAFCRTLVGILCVFVVGKLFGCVVGQREFLCITIVRAWFSLCVLVFGELIGVAIVACVCVCVCVFFAGFDDGPCHIPYRVVWLCGDEVVT